MNWLLALTTLLDLFWPKCRVCFRRNCNVLHKATFIPHYNDRIFITTHLRKNERITVYTTVRRSYYDLKQGEYSGVTQLSTYETMLYYTRLNGEIMSHLNEYIMFSSRRVTR